MPFKTLNIQLQKNIASLGYTIPTPIQAKAMPLILQGRDILGAAQTGTGKTAAYSLPILQMINKANSDELARVQALVIVPTRELSDQITLAIRSFALETELRILNISGGINISKQIASLEKGADIIVATPGRFIELNRQGHIPLSKLQFLVLDEADTILDMGFIREVEQIIDLLPPKRQTILFSATMTGAVKRLSEKILKKPLLVEIDNLSPADLTIRQIVHPIEKEKKSELLSFIIGSNNYPQVLVFTRTKVIADEVSRHLKDSGLPCATIHGDKKHGARDRALKDFRSGEIKILVATDIAARGLDIDDLGVIINYDIPHIPNDYIHRIGRTGRAGKDGVAITLLSTTEQISWRKIETMLGKKPEHITVKGFGSATITETTKTRGKSLTKEAEKPRKADGAFGNKKKKELVQPKYATKRGPKIARVESAKKSKKR
ncbi:MAG: DEAD/DEAH box helicase [Sulfurovaceae bacterium]|nr:DEAD/DEAH box helicase [Sulfurovaceae bacterium]